MSFLDSQRTVRSVMHEPPRPPYRRVEPRDPPQPQQVPLRMRCAQSMGVSAPSCGRASQLKGSAVQKKGFTPVLTTEFTRTITEASETMKELHTFENFLTRHISRPSFLAGDERQDASTLDEAAADDSRASLMKVRPAAAQPPQRLMVRLLPRMFSELLLRHNSVASRLRERGREEVLKHMGDTGRRLGMRVVTSRELYFLLSCIFDEKTLWKDDIEYLFRFFDWAGKGFIDFQDLLDSASLLFVSPEVQAAVHCRRVLNERVLDDSVISIADVDVMLTALTVIFTCALPELPAFCDEVRQTVENVMPTYTVPVSTFRAEVNRISTLRRCLLAVQWDGSVLWSEVLPAPLEDDRGGTHSERLMRLVNTAIADGRERTPPSLSAPDDDYCVDVSHPRFIADAYLIRTGES
ncbi:putative DNA repair protein RAD2 [Trypanosoma conorhini]|uniref:Putative DNA repair protein RAD2 n=1 Tax=Trypanosoma conorhini TaxID=83891 RepID=A0A3R7LLE1_9TRYP|nr:putative DNA repair protein RAD2 [Trypanosoma conorhini]RNF26981.1 putative DNA repair protein RAD2 [Trypanosoma conorhini]